MVHINGPTAYDEPHVPMGGVGDSGFGGRESGYYNMHEMTELKWITVQLGERPMPI
jgi:aldehyde dehydrogenase (NAD+)